MVQPVRRLDEGRAVANRRIGDPHPVRSLTETDILLAKQPPVTAVGFVAGCGLPIFKIGRMGLVEAGQIDARVMCLDS